MHIDTDTIRRLRDSLIAGGATPPRPGPGTAGATATTGKAASMERVSPFVETMYLVMAVDGEHNEYEQKVMLGAMRTLTRGLLDEASLDELIALCARRLEEQGCEARLQAIGSRISAERTDRETAFTLAAAVALADDKVLAEESSLLASIAEWFGLSSRRSREILQQFDPAA